MGKSHSGAIIMNKAKTKEVFQDQWRTEFASLASLTLQCEGTRAIRLHTEMRDCFETILLIATSQTFGAEPGKLTEDKGE